MKHYSAVCFDFDYTLGDSTDSIVAGFQYGFERLGHPIPDRETVRGTIGYLLEIMLPMLDYLALILYPVCCMLGALAFSDKSERRLEEERAAGRRARQWNPHIRTPLCAALSTAVFEGVNLIYVYLSGVALDGGHFGRALVCVLYTAVIAAVIQFPIRWWLGLYKIAKARYAA